jgi:hypothetical protein
MAVNPLSFIGNSSIIDASRFHNPTSEQEEEIKSEFAKLFVEKIFMSRFSVENIIENEEEDDNLFQGMFSNEISKMIIDDIFRQQLAEQMVEKGIIDMGSIVGE